ncbi:serine dehydratase subunit alpha family protein [Lutibacter sp. B2]|nr:serine dehydratase subunit alpha family protein [Lutibacter sp. B2]
MKLTEKIVDILKKEVVPAMGCTEPVAVALACAKAKELIDCDEIDKIDILVSPNIYKNGLCVGIPNTKEVGLEIAAALGVVAGESQKELNVLAGIEKEAIHRAKRLQNSNKISLGIKDTIEKVYVEVNINAKFKNSKVIISEKHNHFSYLEKNGQILFEEEKKTKKEEDSSNWLYNLSICEIIKIIEEIPYEEIEFMLEGIELNEKIAMVGLKNKMGMGVGTALYENMQKGILSDDLINQAMMLTAGASDARMSGIEMSVMSSNGSGNNGLTAILPIVAYKNKFDVDQERLAKAIAISHMVNSYVKHYIGRLSAICGCGVAAATGSSVAIGWLMGANSKEIDGIIKNMIANLSGMICDGAKVGCALKLATSASAAIQSVLLALNGAIVPAQNGIVGETAEETIKNLGVVSSEGMNITDQVILKVMKSMQKGA